MRCFKEMEACEIERLAQERIDEIVAIRDMVDNVRALKIWSRRNRLHRLLGWLCPRLFPKPGTLADIIDEPEFDDCWWYFSKLSHCQSLIHMARQHPVSTLSIDDETFEILTTPITHSIG